MGAKIRGCTLHLAAEGIVCSNYEVGTTSFWGAASFTESLGSRSRLGSGYVLILATL